ncbi:LysM peptidoglycan-binding domain-containing protein [Enterovibrio norvegicus]|uniref:LysM peptidoglycan-binding domain-containing protein n=1 Tax=Enterovibrio norvegicus TaxID=188144 RepID=UPI000C8614C7|nr:LysM domain-containing protein [Enterovibrio norvegicus]PMN67157.1 hypothetical protein BCT27_24260 [Enterovibrio norvegicus]
MSGQTDKYLIQQGDCLSLIAQKFGVSEDDLVNLNSDQIENVDLIYAGDTIKLPGNEAAPIPVKTGERVPLPDPPETNACGDDLCGSSTPEFVDILYVPSHPETKDGEKRWYAVTDVAKEAIKKEMSLLAEAMVAKNRETSLQNLNNLGVLSKFEAKPHEAFLTEKEGKRLRHLEWLISTINSGAAKLYEHGGQDGFIIRVAEQENLDHNKLLARHVSWEKFKQFYWDSHLGAVVIRYVLEATDLIDEISEKEKEAQLMERARLSFFHGVVKHLNESIEDLKEKAVKNAKTVTSKDGTKFIWDKERKYFTSEKQETVTEQIKNLTDARKWTEDEIALTPHENALSQLKLFWFKHVPNSNAHLAKKRNSRTPPNAAYAYGVTKALRELNSHGYVIKEQCLTFDELEGSLLIHQGPKALSGSDSAFGKWRENDNLMFGVKAAALDEKGLKEEAELRKAILLELSMYTTNGEIAQDSIQRASDDIAWAYYPTIALLRVIDVTLEKHMSALGSILNGNQTVPGIFNELITIKKIAINRVNKLKKVAEKRAISGDIKNILLLDNMPKSLHLIWDEKQYAPTEMKRGIFKNDAGAADLQAVECSLLSDGEVKWIRGPSWLIPKSSANKSHLGHVKDITESATLADPTVSKDSPGTTLKDALKDIGKGLIAAPDAKNDFVTKPLNLSAQVKDFDKAFWEDSYHWQDGIGPKGKSSAYIANAQAQFLRLTVSRTGDLNLPGSEINGLSTNMSLTGDTSAKVKLTLLSGEISFATYLPKKEGYHLKIAYVAQPDKNKKPESKMYNAGHFRLKLSTKIYGVAGASCMLSGNLAFGPSEAKPGHIGVKGKAFKAPDYNAHVHGGHSIRTRDASSPRIPQSISAQAGASIDVFAGVEAGGISSTEVSWLPPVVEVSGSQYNSDFIELGSISGQIAVNYGIGFSGELRIGFHNGQFFLITAARLVCGPGVSGKVAIKVNPINADRVVDCLLGILKESGFKYVEALGDIDVDGNNKDFEELNQVLTVAMALGLTFAEVLLLPTKTYNDYLQSILEEDYAPMIAKHIVERPSSKVETWVKNLPPETLSRLFLSLSNKKYDTWRAAPNASYVPEFLEKDVKVLQDEVIKAQAIVKIMEWIYPKDDKDKDTRCSQFEKSLILMEGNLESAQSRLERCRRFAEGWSTLADFISNLDTVGLNEKSKVIAKDAKRDFNNLAPRLCSRMNLYVNEKSYMAIVKDVVLYREFSSEDYSEFSEKIKNAPSWKEKKWKIL